MFRLPALRPARCGLADRIRARRGNTGHLRGAALFRREQGTASVGFHGIETRKRLAMRGAELPPTQGAWRSEMACRKGSEPELSQSHNRQPKAETALSPNWPCLTDGVQSTTRSRNPEVGAMISSIDRPVAMMVRPASAARARGRNMGQAWRGAAGRRRCDAAERQPPSEPPPAPASPPAVGALFSADLRA